MDNKWNLTVNENTCFYWVGAKVFSDSSVVSTLIC